MAMPFPRLTPAQFASPANLRFAYTGWQTVVYNRNVTRKFFYPAFIVAPRHPWRGDFVLFIYTIGEECIDIFCK
jgi:hypothetical protein